MPLLAADIGNSHTVLGLLDDGEVQRRLADRDRRPPYRGRVGGAAARAPRRRTSTRSTGIAVCATVPAVLHEWRDMLARHFPDVTARRGRARRAHRRTGADGQPARGRLRPDHQRARRGHRCTAARRSSSTSAAPRPPSTSSAAPGQYVGGAIAPGIEISLEALGRRGAQLRKVELARPRTVIAKNTVEALQSGMVFGVASAGRGHRRADDRRARRADRDDVRVIATGYLAPLVVDECRCFTDHAPWLTLRGLELAFKRNT